MFFGKWRSARRMGLRDKGKMETWLDENEEPVGWIHMFCKTRIRIGISQGGEPVQYCWRCEVILPDSPPNPKGREDLPEPSVPLSTQAVGDETPANKKVLAFTRKSA